MRSFGSALRLFGIGFVSTAVIGLGQNVVLALLRGSSNWDIFAYVILLAAAVGIAALLLKTQYPDYYDGMREVLLDILGGILKPIGFDFTSSHEPEPRMPVFGIVALVMAIVWFFPCLVIYWALHPHSMKRPIQIVSFFLGIICATSFYIFNKSKLPSVADKVGFFAGVCLSPPTALEFLL